MEDFVRRTYPGQVLDAIEAWFACAPRNASQAERDLNLVLHRFGSNWRVFAGRVYLLDALYLEDDLTAGTLRLLSSSGAPGPAEEYSQAREDLTAGRNKSCVINAHKALESTLKALIGDDQLKFGKLIEECIKRRLVPEYYEDFLNSFRTMLLAAGKTRNSPGGGHGQGKSPKDIPYELARFNLHLAGALITFLIEAHQAHAREETAAADDEDIPF